MNYLVTFEDVAKTWLMWARARGNDNLIDSKFPKIYRYISIYSAIIRSNATLTLLARQSSEAFTFKARHSKFGAHHPLSLVATLSLAEKKFVYFFLNQYYII